MIECSGYRCPGNNWFHLECLDMTEDDVPDDDFYCTPACERRKAYKYCCNVDLGPSEPMIGCDNESCEKGEWFHLKCINMQEVPGKIFISIRYTIHKTISRLYYPYVLYILEIKNDKQSITVRPCVSSFFISILMMTQLIPVTN